jgi:hypothetical protein
MSLSVYPQSLIENDAVSMFPRQRRIFGGVVFYAVRVVSKESRLSVIPRTSRFILRPLAVV